MTAHQALAARRLLLLIAALAATLVAHAISEPGLTLLPAAPLIWGSLACLAVLAGPPGRIIWREHSFCRMLSLLVALQLGLHVAMATAPWAFGLAVHHRPALVTPVALIAHAAAALAMAALLACAERLLTLAQHVARAVRAALAPERSAGRHRAPSPPEPARAPRDGTRRRVRARGPPLPAG